MTSVWLVVPAYQRVELTAVCLEQQRRALHALAADGIGGGVVVVTDDANVDTARRLGLDVVEAPNDLGRRFNDGIQHAIHERGATHVVPIGSDDWVHPDYLRTLLPDQVRTSTRLCLVRPDGQQIACLNPGTTHNRPGYIPWIIPAPLLKRCGYRPCRDDTMTRIDAQMASSLSFRRPDIFAPALVSDVQSVDWKNPRTQITDYGLTLDVNPVAWRHPNPAARLAGHYPADLLDRMRCLYQPAPAGA